MKKPIELWKKLNDTQKFLIVSIPLAVIIFFLIKPYIGTQSSKVPLLTLSNSEFTYSKALSVQAQKGIVQKGRYAIFKFTDKQIEDLETTSKYDRTLSMTFLFEELGDYTENNFKLSYLFDSDFDEKGNYKNVYTERVEVSGNLCDITYGKIAIISFALPKIENQDKVKIPKGFTFSTQEKTKLTSISALPAVTGYSGLSYNFPSNGGKLSKYEESVDFSGSEFVFPAYETASSNMPTININLANTSSETSEIYKDFEQKRIELSIGGENFTLKTAPGQSEIKIPVLPLKNPFSLVEIKSGAEYISGITMSSTVPNYKSKTNGKVLIPYPADPGLILNWSSSKWRNPDYELFSWDRFPNYLIFDFKNYAVQSKYLGRLAFFIEKEGYKGRLLTNEELSGKHDYNAHDYSAESLAKFFTKAKKDHFLLNNEEELLKEILLHNKVILESGDGFTAGEGCILSISQESNGWLRDRLFAHEGWHMFYFSDEEFRNYITACYYTCDAKSLNFLIDYFKSQESLGYDTTDDYLMQNEFMAYLLQQPQSQVADYFVSLAERGSVMKYTKALSDYVKETKGTYFEDASKMINDYCFDRWGITGGNICLIR
ncbi:MAG: hypothetical protein MJ176_02505 [Treponema sp.]|nr:hypothetical protein [Treponema sp.]